VKKILATSRTLMHLQGTRLTLALRRYANAPTFAFPWA